MKEMTLLVMAAGMGSRYGGLKQLDAVGPNGETIIDFSVYDAIRVGYNKVVFIIREDFEKQFKQKISNKYKDKIEAMGFKIYNWDLIRNSINPINELISIYKILKIYKKIKPDIVHHFTIKPCIYGGIVSRLLGIKNTINHITGLGPSFYSNRLKIKYVNKILEPFYKYAFNNNKNNIMNIFHNNSDKNTFIKKLITKKEYTQTIKGSGVDINYFKKEILFKLNKRTKLLFPAR